MALVYRKRITGAAAHKYHAEAVTIDGEWFASSGEARRYHELRLLERAGLITHLERQIVFPLHTRNRETGDVVPVGTYRADFGYCDETGRRVIEDFKGMATLALARWKQKHLAAEYGIVVVETRRR